MEEYFWAICLEENSVQVAIWKVVSGTAEIVDVSSSASWDNDEVLVSALDGCLSSCIQKLPEAATEPTRTVFGVPSSWVADGQIAKEYLGKIKLICDKLSLTPTGFVVLPEAIAHFKKSEDKTPMSAVLVGVYTQNIEVSVFKLGNLMGSVCVARSTSVAEDVIEGFVRFGLNDPYPSRFLIYDSKSKTLEDARQELIKADWDKVEGANFLHTPQVEILESHEKMAAICLAGASEMGEVSQVVLEGETEKNVPPEEVVGEADPTSLGFSVGADSVVSENADAFVHDSVVGKISTTSVLALFKKFKLPKVAKMGKIKENLFFITAVVFLILFVGGFVAWLKLPKATVTIFINPKKIDTHEKLVLSDKAGALDVTKRIVPANDVSTNATGDKSKTTTGTKTIGTGAKGSVIFYNGGDAVTIPSGTTLTASNLEFSLDSDIQIASASGIAEPSSAKGNVTSVGVGADYNLANGTVFSVGNYSSSLIQAKSDTDFSGGSSQEVSAVSKSDVDSLRRDLISELTDKGSGDLKQNLDSGTLLVDSSLAATVASTQLDHQIGEEATTVKLTLGVKVAGLTIQRKDMDELARQLYSSQVPKDFVMKDDQIDFIIGGSDTNFKINLLPSIDTAKLAAQSVGMNEMDAKRLFAKLPGYSDATIEIKPNLFGLNILPHNANNISIVLSGK